MNVAGCDSIAQSTSVRTARHARIASARPDPSPGSVPPDDRKREAATFVRSTAVVDAALERTPSGSPGCRRRTRAARSPSRTAAPRTQRCPRVRRPPCPRSAPAPYRRRCRARRPSRSAPDRRSASPETHLPQRPADKASRGRSPAFRARLGEHHIAGLQVAMRDAARMRRVERRWRLDAVLQSRSNGSGPRISRSASDSPATSSKTRKSIGAPRRAAHRDAAERCDRHRRARRCSDD